MPGSQVRPDGESASGCTSSATPNAFDIMTQAQREKSKQRIPTRIDERNRKDELFNVLLAHLEKHNLCWRSDEVDSIGVNFVKSHCEALWYIDGHHTVLAARSCPIPEPFTEFEGFNPPEVTKHRKRTASNMSSAVLEALSAKLFGLLQSNFFLREKWAELRRQCEKLAHSMKKYANELQGKNKAMKLVHASPTPWRSIAKGLDLFYVKLTANICPELTELSSKVIEVGLLR